MAATEKTASLPATTVCDTRSEVMNGRRSTITVATERVIAVKEAPATA